jgi:hypothetical protein
MRRSIEPPPLPPSRLSKPRCDDEKPGSERKNFVGAAEMKGGTTSRNIANVEVGITHATPRTFRVTCVVPI